MQALYQQRRVYVDPQYYRPLGIPTVVFSVGNYWDRYYRDRLTQADLIDPQLLREGREALDALTSILQLGSVYPFQR